MIPTGWKLETESHKWTAAVASGGNIMKQDNKISSLQPIYSRATESKLKHMLCSCLLATSGAQIKQK